MRRSDEAIEAAAEVVSDIEPCETVEDRHREHARWILDAANEIDGIDVDVVASLIAQAIIGVTRVGQALVKGTMGLPRGSREWAAVEDTLTHIHAQAYGEIRRVLKEQT